MGLRMSYLVSVLIVLLGFTSTEGLKCYTCTSSALNPLKCTKQEYLGTFKECPTNTSSCYKSVKEKTGEVNKGCTPQDSMKSFNVEVDGVKTVFCDSRLCNGKEILAVSRIMGYLFLLNIFVK